MFADRASITGCVMDIHSNWRAIARILLSAAACVLAAVAAAAEPGEIEALVRRLGSPGFQDRQEASVALGRIGAPAREALEQAARSSDPEVSIRARELLRAIRSGISPAWPEDIRLKAFAFRTLSREDKNEFMRKLMVDHEADFIPFFLAIVERGDDEACADFALNCLLKADNKKAALGGALDPSSPPANLYQARLLVAACAWSMEPADIARALGVKAMDARGKEDLVRLALDVLSSGFKAGKYEKVVKDAGLFAGQGDARILYYQAMALTELGRKDEAAGIEQKALALNPGSEASHFAAGEMLMSAGCYRLAELEWKKILDIPPADDVYDINAWMRLGSLYSHCGMHAKAADALETGMEKYKTARKKYGQSMGMMGGDNLEAEIAALRAKAAEDGDKVQGVTDAPAGEHVTITITTSVKDGKADEMRKELQNTVACMTVNVQPYGFRLFEEAPSGVRYDTEKKELVVLLNDSPCAAPAKCTLRQKVSTIGIFNLDRCYIFSVDRDTGKASRIKSYDKDYTVRLTPGPAVGKWKDILIKLNGAEYKPQDLANGMPFDFLPKTLELEVTGKTPSGEEKQLTQKINPSDYVDNRGASTSPVVIRVSINAQ